MAYSQLAVDVNRSQASLKVIRKEYLLGAQDLLAGAQDQLAGAQGRCVSRLLTTQNASKNSGTT